MILKVPFQADKKYVQLFKGQIIPIVGPGVQPAGQIKLHKTISLYDNIEEETPLVNPPACFSHLLFLGDMLAIVTNRAKQECEISRVVPQLVDGGQSILQYADDTILLMEHNFEKAVNMKLPYVLLSSYQGPKLISTKMRFTALVKKNQQQYITLWLPKGEYPFR